MKGEALFVFVVFYYISYEHKSRNMNNDDRFLSQYILE